MLVIPTFVTSVLLAAIPTTLVTAASDVCTNLGSSRNGVDCSFTSWCGWQNLKYADLKWNRFRSYDNGWYAYADMAPGTSAGLTSPVLCSTENQLYTLEFEYFIEASGQCMLSVSLNVSGSFPVPVWNTTQTSRTEDRTWRTQQVPIGSPRTSFQIIIRATRLGSEPCGPQYTAVYLDSLKVTVTTTTTKTDPPTTSAISTDASLRTVNVSNENSTANMTKIFTVSSNNEDTNLTTTDFAAAIGAGLAVAVVVAVVVVIVIILRKLRSSNNKERETSSLERRRTGVLNDFYTAVNNSVSLRTDDGGSRVITGWPSSDTSKTDTIPDNRRASSHYYSHPDSPTFRAEVRDIQNTSNNSGFNRLSSKGGDIISASDFVSGKSDVPSFALRSVASRAADDRPRRSNSENSTVTYDSYNKLSFDTTKSAPSKANPPQTYNHLNEITATEGEQSMEEGEYSLPQDEYETSFQDETNQRFRVKNGKGKKKQQNSPASKGSHTSKSAQQNANEHRENRGPAESYDKNESGHHGFREQEPEKPEYVNMDSVGSARNRQVLSGEYNKLDFKGHGPENGRRSDDLSRPDNYSHLDEFTFNGV